MKERDSGVLLNISSLPSPYGVGVFGYSAVEFARIIADMGFSRWQVLPFNPLDFGNSPYGTNGAFAGNILYIDPMTLLKDGYITKSEEEYSRYNGSPYTADYQFASERRLKVLMSAFERADDSTKSKASDYCQKNNLSDYALYTAYKEINNQKPFWEWADGNADIATARKNSGEIESKKQFYEFCQYVFFLQWEQTKKRINACGIDIIGDIPIYIALDSADVWASPHLFEIDKTTFKPKKVAGVPPDYFSKDGQLWGNPLYNWALMEKDGYDWWCNRLCHSLKLYDTVRIDHFRGLASYWAVDGDKETAKEGEWLEGPGIKLFDALKKRVPNPSIIAEDLGVFGEDVVNLLKDTGIAGMRIIQFGFAPGENSTHLPHNYPKNSIAYVGTHDNNTLLGWLWEATPQEREFALRYCGCKGCNWSSGGNDAPAVRAITETVWRSASKTAIIQFADMCGFGSDARMNKPGTVGGNWLFRTTFDTINSVDKRWFSEINNIFSR